MPLLSSFQRRRQPRSARCSSGVPACWTSSVAGCPQSTSSPSSSSSKPDGRPQTLVEVLERGLELNPTRAREGVPGDACCRAKWAGVRVRSDPRYDVDNAMYGPTTAWTTFCKAPEGCKDAQAVERDGVGGVVESGTQADAGKATTEGNATTTQRLDGPGTGPHRQRSLHEQTRAVLVQEHRQDHITSRHHSETRSSQVGQPSHVPTPIASSRRLTGPRSTGQWQIERTKGVVQFRGRRTRVGTRTRTRSREGEAKARARTMATLERARPAAQVDSSLDTLRSGVPSLPSDLVSALASTSSSSGAGAPLDFSPRTRWAAARGEEAGRPDADHASSDWGVIPSSSAPTPRLDVDQQTMLEDTVQSLVSARSAFLDILLSLLNPPLVEFSDDGHGPLASSSTSAPQSDGLHDETDEFAAAVAVISRAHPAAASTVAARSHASTSASSSRLTPRHEAESGSSLRTLLALIDATAGTLPSAADSCLAQSLGSLLELFDRLIVLAEGSTPSIASSQTPSVHTATPRLGSSRIEKSGSATSHPNRYASAVGVYEAIQRETRALQDPEGGHSYHPTGAGRGRSESITARRQLQSAEAEYLWGKVDDLLDAVGDLCRERLEQNQDYDRMPLSPQDPFADPFASPPTASATPGLFRTSTRLSLESHTGSLPRYSHDFDLSSPNVPPQYESDTKSLLSDRGSETAFALNESGTRLRAVRESPGGENSAQVSAAMGEKMQRELDSITSAIERLYRSAPQLANQRANLTSPRTRMVDPVRRREIRDRQLDAVFSAIERLSRGRLEHQRAEVPQSVADGITGMGWDSGMREDRLRKQKEKSLRTLLDGIDRAQARRLDGQRGEMRAPGKRPMQLVEGGRSRSYAGKSNQVAGEPIGSSTTIVRSSSAKANRTFGLADFLDGDAEADSSVDAEADEEARLRSARKGTGRAKSVPFLDASAATPPVSAMPAPPVKKKFSISLLSRPSPQPGPQQQQAASHDAAGTAADPPKSPLRSGFLNRVSPALSRRDSQTTVPSSAANDAAAADVGLPVAANACEPTIDLLSR